MADYSLVLAALNPTKGQLLKPVQVQKLFFLLDRHIAKDLGGKLYHFRPGLYGPYDERVFEDLDSLEKSGFIAIVPDKSLPSYGLTDKGISLSECYFDNLTVRAKDYILRACEYVLALDPVDLVAQMCKAFPDMAAKSILQA